MSPKPTPAAPTDPPTAPLSDKQRARIRSLHPKQDAAAIARSMRLPVTSVEAYLETLEPERRTRREARIEAERADRVKRERLFKWVLLVLPLVVLLLLEGVLRLVGFGSSVPVFIADDSEGYDGLVLNPQIATRYFRTTKGAAPGAYDVFRRDKPADGLRIFCLGESATAGFPYPADAASFPALLRRRLRQVYPTRTIEVVNLGVTALSSYALTEFTDALVDQHPDAVLVYAGNNEYYGALSVGSTEGLGRHRWLVKTYLALRPWRVFQLLQRIVGGVSSAVGSGEEGSRGTLMSRMAEQKLIGLGSPVYQAGIDVFRANLTEMVETCKSAGVPILVGNLVAIERGLPPFVSVEDAHALDPTAPESPALPEADQAATFVAARRFADALPLLNRAVAARPVSARLEYARAVCLDSLGQTDSARIGYERAKDLDGLRFRAPSALNDAIAEVCRTEKVPFVDIVSAFRKASSGGILDHTLLTEHVHPTADGYRIVANTFGDALRDSHALGDDWPTEREPTAAEADSLYALTPMDRATGALRIALLKNDWPFTSTPVAQPYTPRTPAERMAWALYHREGEITSWERGHVALAEQYVAAGQLDLAAAEYRTLALAYPSNVSPYLRLGQLYLQAHQPGRALPWLARAQAVEPTPQGAAMLALARRPAADTTGGRP